MRQTSQSTLSAPVGSSYKASSVPFGWFEGAQWEIYGTGFHIKEPSEPPDSAHKAPEVPPKNCAPQLVKGWGVPEPKRARNARM
eukprot:7220754-Pyramimonas_sp.AAC.1